MDMQDGVTPEFFAQIQELENKQREIYKGKMRRAFMAGVLFANLKNDEWEIPHESEAFEEWFRNEQI